MTWLKTAASLFACPHCLRESLRDEEQRLSCEACGASYPVEDGIPVFREHPAAFDWGVPGEWMERMLKDVETHGWHDAMMRLCQELSPREAQVLWLRTLGCRRAAVQMLLPCRPDARILDLGAGWGGLTLQLAPHCAEVVAFDQIHLHLRWLRAVSAALGIKNLILAQGGDTEKLPFPSETFDGVILNGVLEWVASHTPGNPMDVQQRMLQEAARVLKPSGVLYVGIENRLNYKYFLGVPEGHLNMKFGALLPRRVTHWYLSRRRGRPFREYT